MSESAERIGDDEPDAGATTALDERERQSARQRKQKHDEKLRNQGRLLCPDEPERFACVIHVSEPAKRALAVNRRNNRILGVGPVLDSKYVEDLLLEDVERGQGFWRGAKDHYQPRQVEAANLSLLVKKIQYLELSNRKLQNDAAELRKERRELRESLRDSETSLLSYKESYEGWKAEAQQLASRPASDEDSRILDEHKLSSVEFELFARALTSLMVREAPYPSAKREIFRALTGYLLDLVHHDGLPVIGGLPAVDEIDPA